MDTSAISYRVADFLKQHPPFHVMAEEDLLQLSRRGKVKFFEPNQYVLPPGGFGLHVLVIQQGAVLLWDERGAETKLLDVRGAGDLLGIDQSNDGRSRSFSARSASDVLVYAFPAQEFDALVEKYPSAKQYVSAHGGVTADYRSSQERRGPENVLLRDLAAENKFPTCDAQDSIRNAAQRMMSSGGDSIVAMDSDQRALGVLTAVSFLKWIAGGGADSQEPVATLFDSAPLAIGADASVASGVLALGAAEASALAITSDGTANGRVQAIVSSQDLGRIFGDRPVEIIREIRRAADVRSLRELNQRARSLVLQYLTNAAAADWLAGFTSLLDTSIARQIIAMSAEEDLAAACWCFCGSSGRGESLTMAAPQVVMIADDAHDHTRGLGAYQRVSDLLRECGYLTLADAPFEPSFYAASAAEWKRRYYDWVNDPILKEIYRARLLFDLRPIRGQQSLFEELELAVTNAVNPEFLHVMANDCLATLPPLTFFQNAVVDETGEETTVFRLEDTALRPLVDVGRVFGMAGKKIFGSSTLERFAMAARLQPAHASIFQEASEALRVVLWQQGRIGISQGTAGSEAPPAQLSRYDRQILRNGFRSILRLLEFTGDMRWLNNL